MIKKYEIENIIQEGLESVDGQTSTDGTVYEAEVTKNKDGDLIFKFIEDSLGDRTPVYYKINIEYIGHDYKE